MSLLLSSSFSITPPYTHLPFKFNPFSNSISIPTFTFIKSTSPKLFPLSKTRVDTHPTFQNSNYSASALSEEDFGNTSTTEEEEFEYGDLESPWEGAIVYHRNPSVTHLECCTTLERLGMGALSSHVSRSRASVMGLRVTRAVRDFPLGTPVLVSADVTRKRQKLRLDGIVRTVITLACNRCGEPTAEPIFSNFSLLLTEEPIKEPEIINLGVIFGEDKNKTFDSEEEEDALIDFDDLLYFPPEEKTIDISKQIRDTVHVEITINSVCDPMCKGLCLKCGSNLNTSVCNCTKEVKQEKSLGPLKDLKKQIQKN